MLKEADVSIEKFLNAFASIGTKVAFLVPTSTGYEKSIMDAIISVRELLKDYDIHNYDKQLQGQEHKINVKAYFVDTNNLIATEASLYRPVTKQGDPRIWFKGLKKYCKPYNLLALVIVKKSIYVINLSNKYIAESLFDKEYVYDVIYTAKFEEDLVVNELKNKIQKIHNEGFIKSVSRGDFAVGDTLENALGIFRNNNKQPDYKGIELKATRISKNGKERIPTRTTLFTKVPDIGMTYREILENYGKIQIPKGSKISRLQLYETCRFSRKNAYDLQLGIDVNENLLDLLYVTQKRNQFVSAWYIEKLKNILLEKHKETFWVKANTSFKNGVEYFSYDIIIHTRKPNVSLIVPLLETDKITVDLAAHIENNKYRDHGILFKMLPQDISLLFPNIVEYNLMNKTFIEKNY